MRVNDNIDSYFYILLIRIKNLGNYVLSAIVILYLHYSSYNIRLFTFLIKANYHLQCEV